MLRLHLHVHSSLKELDQFRFIIKYTTPANEIALVPILIFQKGVLPIAVDVWICVLMSIVVVGLFTFFYHKLFVITFDADFARATGVPAGAYDVLIAVVTAVVIVLAMNLVGSLLTSALIVFPALSAMQAFKSYRQVVICSAVISVLCAVLGIFISILASTPVGSTIVAANVLFFLVFYTLGKIMRGNI